MTFDSRIFEDTCDSTQGSLYPSPWKYIKVCGYSDPIFQKLKPKVIDPYMTFDPTSVKVTCVTLPKDHCVKFPWEYIHLCGYSDQFCKTSTKITIYYVHTAHYGLRTEWVIT